MQRYPWLQTVYHQILNSYRQGRGHYALLLSNKWNNGEDILINTIIRWLICSNPYETQCCNICYNCQLMNIGHYPDYYQIDLENNSQTIGVDVIRMCIEAIQKHAFYNKCKVIYIKRLEYLTDQATNVLLKTLEEPPANTYFFLKTQEYMNISLTLLSRCIRWSIKSPQESFGLEWLIQQEGIHDILLAQCALRLCNGAPIAAKVMLKTECWKQRLRLCNAVNHAILSGDFLKLLPFLNIYNNNTPLYWLITLLVDTLKWKQGVKKKFIVNLDQIELISLIADKWNMLSLSNQLQQWLILIRYFNKFINVNNELLLTYRLLNWKQDIIEFCFNTWSI